MREPGGTSIGEEIRKILLNPANQEISDVTEFMLYFASRAQLIKQRVKSAISRGEIVLADRYFTSSLVYQGYANNMPLNHIRSLVEIACSDCMFDLALFFDVPCEIAAKRLGSILDRMEMKGLEFHRMVRQGYLEVAKQYADKVRVIDTKSDVDSVFAKVVGTFESFAAENNFYEGLRKT